MLDTGLGLLEPACGNGNISNVLQRLGFDVYEQDLYGDYVQTHQDYLTTTDPEHCCQISNPPYGNMKYLFLKKAFEANRPFAYLLSMDIFTTVMGSEMFEKYPLRIYAFRRNIKFDHDGQESKFANMAWFIGNWGVKRQFVELYYIDSLDPKEDERLHNFDAILQDINIWRAI
jgi:hypothetical protein